MVKIEKLDPREYEHPLDRSALDALEKTNGLDTLVKKFYEYGIERMFNIQCTGSHLKVTPSSLPEVYEMVEESCETLFLPQTPDIYIQHTEMLHGFVTGVDRPIIVLSSSAIDDLTPAENRFMIGRMIGHVKSQHVLYYEIGYLLPVLSEILAGPTLGIGSLLTMGLQVALLHWSRMSEYTADRAGLLCCQDVAAASSALAKMAGLPKAHYADFNIDDFVTQAREFEGYDETNYNRVLKYVSLMFGEKTWSVERANQLIKWVDSGEYKAVLDRKTDFNKPLPEMKFCPNCGNKLVAAAKFCSNCGNRFVV